jgi:hypothetical protein
MNSVKRVLKLSVELVCDQGFTEEEIFNSFSDMMDENELIDACTIEIEESHDCVIFDTNQMGTDIQN